VSAVAAWVEAATQAATTWEAVSEPEHESAAIEELRNRHTVSDTLFGRLGRR
jgi:hypothetical protein